MAENKNKYVSPIRLSLFLDNLKGIFSPLAHDHKITDLTDYVVDTTLSPNSGNPIANNVVDAEFEAISEALKVYDIALDDKIDKANLDDALADKLDSSEIDEITPEEIVSLFQGSAQLINNCTISRHFNDGLIAF